MIVGKIVKYEEPFKSKSSQENLNWYGMDGYEDYDTGTGFSNGYMTREKDYEKHLAETAAEGLVVGARVRCLLTGKREGVITEVITHHTIAYNFRTSVFEPFRVDWDGAGKQAQGFQYASSELELIEAPVKPHFLAKVLPLLLQNQGANDESNSNLSVTC